jgi:hypothetical protein
MWKYCVETVMLDRRRHKVKKRWYLTMVLAEAQHKDFIRYGEMQTKTILTISTKSENHNA